MVDAVADTGMREWLDHEEPVVAALRPPSVHRLAGGRRRHDGGQGVERRAQRLTRHRRAAAASVIALAASVEQRSDASDRPGNFDRAASARIGASAADRVSPLAERGAEGEVDGHRVLLRASRG
jgi:hypothetical protein